MKKKYFFTEEFYLKPQLTLDVMNELVKKGQVADQDMYQSGTFLFMEVFENETTKKILSSVISDLEAYKKYNNENYASDESTEIGLCALHDEHTVAFRWDQGDKCIKWDAGIKEFVFNEDFEYEENMEQ